MPTPKFRTSSSKRDSRRSHHALKQPGLAVCANCGETKRPHVACLSCGHYAGKQVMEPLNQEGPAASEFTPES